jgi:membrane-associated protease RseP (regulator of RpoE activity)
MIRKKQAACCRRWAWLAALATLAALCPVTAATPQADAGRLETYRVPYQLTETKHVLVRVKVNGKGPFNFIVDTGAPALFIGTEAAKKMGVKPDKNGWGTFENFEIEGGIKLKEVKGRIEDPFQLIGMNKMNLPGIRYDGMMGYTVLAKYRIQYDFTRPYLVWTKLDWEPPFPRGLMEMGGKMPTEITAMSGLVQFAALIVGRRPDPEMIHRGLLGVELAEEGEGVVVKKTLPNSPAAEAGLKEGDRLTAVQGKPVADLKELHRLTAEHSAGHSLKLEIVRGGKTETFTLKAIKGL